MAKRMHFAAGVLAMVVIATFFASTLAVELAGSPAAIAALKRWIVVPGLLVLVPLLAATGGTGFALARAREGRLVDAKKRRMPFIVVNGLLVLVPCAILLDRWASAGAFDATFVAVQALELVAGATNLLLMGMNARDGLRLSGRLRARRPA